MSKLATIYQRKGAFFVGAAHKTQAGFWVADAEIEIVEQSDEIGLQKAIAVALARSQIGVPTPRHDADLTSSLLKAAKVSSWNTFAKAAKCVDVCLKNGVIEITPYKNLGGRDGFVPMPEYFIRLPESVDNLGASVRAAFSVAK